MNAVGYTGIHLCTRPKKSVAPTAARKTTQYNKTYVAAGHRVHLTCVNSDTVRDAKKLRTQKLNLDVGERRVK